MDLIGQKIGNYRITRQLGRGGMGVVVEAVNEEIGARAAIKVLHARFAADPKTLRRFVNEARAVNLVAHSGLVHIHDAGHLEGGLVYLAMEHLPGESLQQRLTRTAGPLPQPLAIRLATEIAEVVAAVHDKHIIHRDLKPSNVMIVPDPAMPTGERVKVLDFGIAKLAQEHLTPGDADLTLPFQVLGTPQYMAPDQWDNAREATDRVDVYALGVMIYQMVVGRVPFEGAYPHLAALHRSAAPPRLADVAPEAPAELCALLQRMLAKAPLSRPSMAEAARTLAGLDAGATLLGRYTGPLPPPRDRRYRYLPLLCLSLSVMALSAASALRLGRRPPPPGPTKKDLPDLRAEGAAFAEAPDLRPDQPDLEVPPADLLPLHPPRGHAHGKNTRNQPPSALAPSGPRRPIAPPPLPPYPSAPE